MKNLLNHSHRPVFAALVLALTAGIAFSADAPEKKKRRTAAPSETSAKVERDIPYSTNGGVTLKLDIYSPKTRSSAPAPVAVYIHGGGWSKGNKSNGGWLPEVAEELTGRGYVVASVDYRLVPTVQWPAFLHDCKAAVRFLRANASKYHLDPDHIGTWGGSAGGHLVSLLGTTDAGAKLEGDGGWAEQSSRVQAVVDMFGPADLPKMMRDPQRAATAFGDAPDALKQASPVNYISRDDPPFLILQGDSDTLVPVEQSKILHEQLTAAGVKSKLVIVKNGTHGLNGEDLTPTRAEMVKMMADFFDEHLRKPAVKKP